MPSRRGATKKLHRDHQKVQPTLGYHFVSPKRKRPSSKKRQVVLQAFGDKKQTKLQEELKALKAKNVCTADNPFVVENRDVTESP